jgi:Arylsulfatase regulator (Fe-S oxidoreductase)
MGNLRLSNYTIITKIDEIDKYFLLHGYSGAMALLSNELGKIIENNEIEKLEDEEKDYLISKYFLTTMTEREEKEEVKKAFDKFDKIYRKSAAAFLFIFTYDCSFRCFYCYEQNLLRKGKDWLKKRMNKNDVDEIFKTMKEINQDFSKTSITYYGGEPLMKENYDIVCYTTDKLMEEGCKSIDIITNGYEIENYEKYFGNPFTGMQITIDGLLNTHNKRRFTSDGKGTFDKIIENIELALSKKVRIRVRGNVDKSNVMESEKLKSFFDEKNSLKMNIFLIIFHLLTMKK